MEIFSGTDQEDLSPPPIPERPKYFQKSESNDFEEVKKLEEDGKDGKELGATGFDKSKIKVKEDSPELLFNIYVLWIGNFCFLHPMNPFNFELLIQKKAVEGKDLMTLMEEQEKLDLIPNMEQFECLVCLSDIPSGGGIVLRECLHNFCKECLANAVEFCEDAVVKCPYRDSNYSCTSHLLDREVKNLVSPKIYEKHLQISIRKAESQDSKSFHCKTPNCTGWCLFEDSVNVFDCPVCNKQNCLNCQAIHTGKNCLQYQADFEFQESKDENVRKTKKFLNVTIFKFMTFFLDYHIVFPTHSMIVTGTAMRCPKCQVVVLKKWGCDWLKCCVCDTEICWVTKGPRWGPAGRGDTSGGCRCRVNGLKCHPLCQYCH
ncbi:RanBP-type and C3HC4-type zinc finger-containing protein 1 [Nymphon striatum]|nr:RanBP-type and C3HC4-type zinc finger-containing protein 1 [Nymphon striatum]